MNPTSLEKPLVLRAALSSYLVLGGPWIVIALGYLAMCLTDPGKGGEQVVVIAGGVALLWACWLLGFKIRVSDSHVEYRSGLWKSSRIALLNVQAIEVSWMERHVITRKIPMMRLVIVPHKGPPLVINPKPFKRSDLERFRQRVSRDRLGK